MDLTRLLVAIANLDHKARRGPTQRDTVAGDGQSARPDEFFLAERLAQVYEGDTALHAAGFSYEPDMARDLITRGADIRARNRRGAEPLHAAVICGPGSASWNPACQRDVILYLIEAGADPNAAAAGGVTPPASSYPKPMFGYCRRPPARRCRSSPPKRPRLDRVRPRFTGQPGAVARAPQRSGPNNESLSKCSR
jgi:ankyrin repeat protein